MSILARLLAWLGGSRPSRRDPHPDRLSLTDWADLPPHHPGNETC